MKAIINEIIQDFKLNNIFEKIQSYLYFPEFKIGEGTFSISYFRFNELTKEPCIIKIQKNDIIKNGYNSDILGLIHLEKSPYFPNYLYFSNEGNRNILIESLFGPTLKTLFSF